MRITTPFQRPASALVSRIAGKLLFSLLLAVSAVQADLFDDVAFTELQAELGASLPDGAGLQVDLIEASYQVGQDFAWLPNPGSLEFLGKTINDISGSTPGLYSAHAGNVGARFFGSVSSATPAIPTINAYSASGWVGSDFIRTQVGGFPVFQPAFTASRIANHSWVGTTQTNDADVLARLDWVIETDDMLQFVVFNGSVTNVLLANAYNVISVNRTAAPTNGGTVSVGGIYQSGRTKPELVVSDTSPSNGTPRVSSTAALMIDAAHNNPSWSTDPVTTSTTNRNGDTIYNAERSEVIKAALMAGASRATRNTWPGPPYALTDIDDYRALSQDQTANGLDRRYGAGQLNMYNSYFIVAGGEQNSIEDDAGSGGQITNRGFDYDPAFGGSGTTNATATYYLAQSADPIRLTASLVWNLDINGGTPTLFNSAATLYDLDLNVYDVTDPQNWILVASSASTDENTENMWLLLDGSKDYALQVVPGAGQSAFNWDFALAWQATPVPPLTLQLDYLPPSATRNQFYYYDGPSVTGGEPPYTWSLAGGWLPWQLELTQQGVIQGIPSEVTTAYFTLQVTDSNGDSATVQSSVQVKNPDYVCGACHAGGEF